MCEVGSCCGCISLYKGCFIIGLVTMLASASQVLVFSFILFASYDSSTMPNSPLNETSQKDSSPSYSFHSSLCPFGFIPMKSTSVNVTEPKNISFSGNMSLSGNLSLSGNFSFEEDPPATNSTITDLSCLAPPQGVLWAIVIASGCYAPVGIVLMIGVRKGVSCLLSTWFFYTVGYNLLCLIVALTDGVYTGAGDISSYVVCLVTAYCVIVVDSYYEKQLLRHEKAVQSATAQGRPSLVVVKSTPVSPTSPESSPVYNPPLGKFISVPPGYAPPGEASDLLLPSRASPSRDLPRA